VEKRENEAVVIKPQLVIPSVENDYWFIVNYNNVLNTEITRYFGFDISCFEIADLYYKNQSGWVHIRNGLTIPIDNRTVYSRLPVFEVTFKPSENKTLYLHLRSKYLVPTKIVSKNTIDFKKTENTYLFIYWLYIGAAISILLYNLLLFIQLRDKVYLYYILYVTFLLIWILLDSGIFLYFSSDIKLYYFLSIGSPTMAFFLTLFTREILKIWKVSRWINICLIVISIIYLIIAILVAFDVYYYQYLGVVAMPFTLFLLFVGIYGMIKKLPLSRFYVFASTFYIIGLFLYASLTLDAIPYTPISRYGFMVGSFFELIVFSLALGYRIKLIEAEKIRLQELTIENERNMSHNLEVKVKERTEELLTTSEELENTNQLLSIQIEKRDKAIIALQESDAKLKESNKAKEKLFSIISHDLRSPFNAILGYASLLITDYDKFNDLTRKKFISAIYQSSHSTFTLLDNLLTWARNQQDKIILNKEDLSLTELVSLSIEPYLLSAQKKKIKIEIIIPNERIIKVDKYIISTVIGNIVNNSIKFTHEGGSINIKSTLENTSLQISIEDNGIGMNSEKQQKVFTVDENISTIGTNDEKGTGLGLVLCKEFIEKHSGSIWVDSEEGRGSTFYFSIEI